MSARGVAPHQPTMVSSESSHFNPAVGGCSTPVSQTNFDRPWSYCSVPKSVVSISLSLFPLFPILRIGRITLVPLGS
jgi:hypothetical protein